MSHENAVQSDDRDVGLDVENLLAAPVVDLTFKDVVVVVAVVVVVRPV